MPSLGQLALNTAYELFAYKLELRMTGAAPLSMYTPKLVFLLMLLPLMVGLVAVPLTYTPMEFWVMVLAVTLTLAFPLASDTA